MGVKERLRVRGKFCEERLGGNSLGGGRICQQLSVLLPSGLPRLLQGSLRKLSAWWPLGFAPAAITEGLAI